VRKHDVNNAEINHKQAFKITSNDLLSIKDTGFPVDSIFLEEMEHCDNGCWLVDIGNQRRYPQSEIRFFRTVYTLSKKGNILTRQDVQV
jgi:hypothetical protein